MKKNKTIWIIGIVVLALFVLAVILSILRGSEDSWIMDEKGVWIMHGNTTEIPDYVGNQQTALNCANDLYAIQGLRGMHESQCLGSCYDYAVDLVYAPRIDVDNLAENQCAAYRNGTLQHFIEVNNKNGDIVRVV